jgi:DNA-directed RNA polymerase specialized sigma24 family protein
MMGSSEDEQQRFRLNALPALLALHRLARALCADRSAADDLLQETYLRGLRYFRTYQGGDIRAWLAAIMRCGATNRVRFSGCLSRGTCAISIVRVWVPSRPLLI